MHKEGKSKAILSRKNLKKEDEVNMGSDVDTRSGTSMVKLCVSLLSHYPWTDSAPFTTENMVRVPLNLIILENRSRKPRMNSENSSRRFWSSGKASGTKT